MAGQRPLRHQLVDEHLLSILLAEPEQLHQVSVVHAAQEIHLHKERFASISDVVKTGTAQYNILGLSFVYVLLN